MSKRKTVSVDELVNWGNRMLTRNTISADEKKGICSMIEHVLHASDRYSGFNYSYWWSGGGFEAWRKAGEPESKDEFMYGPGGSEWDRIYFLHALPATKRSAPKQLVA